MSTVIAIPLRTYLETVYRPDCEYLDGELLERNVGEWDHSRLQGLLPGNLLQLEKQLGILVVPKPRVKVQPTRFRVPAIAVILGAPPDKPIVDQPPLLCIEILSRRDRIEEMQERIDDYLAFGVPYVWLIHPRTRRAFVYTTTGVEEAKDGLLRTSAPEICVSLPDLYT